jgi:hypothetical protein
MTTDNARFMEQPLRIDCVHLCRLKPRHVAAVTPPAEYTGITVMYMAKYFVKLKAPAGHAIPALLQDFGDWLAKQTHGSLGYFELITSRIPKEWNLEAAQRLTKDGFSFLELGDGSLLVLLNRPEHLPAVVLLGSEGDTSTVATSLEEFLQQLGKGETGIDDLDDEEATGRGKLQAWLKKNNVIAPKAPPFDFDAYLDGVPQPAATAEVKPAPASQVVPQDVFSELRTMLGKPLDSAEVVNFLARHPKHKATQPSSGEQHVVSYDSGFEMVFGPPDGNYRGGRTKEPRVLTTLFLNSAAVAKFKTFTLLPLGLSFDDGPEQLISKLGIPTRTSVARDTGEIDGMKWLVDGLILDAEFIKGQPTTKVFTLMTHAAGAQFL